MNVYFNECVFLMSTYIYVSLLLPKVDQFDEKLYVYEDCTMIFV